MIFDWILIAFAFVLALLGTLLILLGIALAVTFVKRWWTGESTESELEALIEATREDKQ